VTTTANKGVKDGQYMLKLFKNVFSIFWFILKLKFKLGWKEYDTNHFFIFFVWEGGGRYMDSRIVHLHKKNWGNCHSHICKILKKKHISHYHEGVGLIYCNDAEN
jgi:hypothetical protein